MDTFLGDAYVPDKRGEQLGTGLAQALPLLQVARQDPAERWIYGDDPVLTSSFLRRPANMKVASIA